MANLRKYYNARVNSLEKEELLKQVGHSVNGKAISIKDFESIIMDINNALDLSNDDDLLDLCCGNGVITKQLSTFCHSIYGVDFSHELISIAKTNSSSNNEYFINCDIFDIHKHLSESINFSKVLMFGSLQHFTHQRFSDLLELIKSLCGKEFTIFFGFVTDKDYKWQFYNTIKKRLLYFYRRLMKTDVMGTWWDKKNIKSVCEEMNLECHFININFGNYGYPYRFHFTVKNITKKR
ncbi:MAG: class I SAM-dependent methyltransferase [Alcanivoracaceae bacterium]|nr:class I SAM-dependent methyltransferase [Alcanivoracaceae bacterium]